MIIRCLLPLIALALPLTGATAGDASAAGGLQRDVAFADYSSLSDGTEIMRRLLSPLNAMRVQQALAHSGHSLLAEPIDLNQEKFALYVPPGAPPANGYAAMVFIPPWEDARVPVQWLPVLNRHHMIYVSAANSGNVANVLDRREPLALLAEYNVTKRYHVNPHRVYMGGFSGGSRIALRLALAYPDVFDGALLDGGSDQIGTATIPLPPADLFRQFQGSTKLVYMTGADDTIRLDQERASQLSMHDWCIFDVDTVTVPSAGHELADPMVLEHALRALEQPAQPNLVKLSECRARIDWKLSVQLQRAQSLIDAGKINDSKKLLEEIDALYGGLAVPRSIRLMRKIDAQFAKPVNTN